jgi:hypothetical protein
VTEKYGFIDAEKVTVTDAGEKKYNITMMCKWLARCLEVGILRVVRSAGVGYGGSARPVGRADRGALRGLGCNLRAPAYPRRTGPPWRIGRARTGPSHHA